MSTNKYVRFTLFVIMAMVLWTLVDYGYASLIMHQSWQFVFGPDLLMGLATAAAVGYFVFLREE